MRAATSPTGPDLVFYDGACGFCHAAVRRCLNCDPSGTLFRYAPLHGACWRERLPVGAEAPRETVVVRTADGRWLVRAAAALHLARRGGGLGALLAAVAGALPRPVADLAYRAVARVRHRLAARPDGPCPVLAPDLRARFDLRP